MKIKNWKLKIGIIVLMIIMAAIGLTSWYSEKSSPLAKELAKLGFYSEKELLFLEKEGFLALGSPTSRK